MKDMVLMVDAAVHDREYGKCIVIPVITVRLTLLSNPQTPGDGRVVKGCIAALGLGQGGGPET